MPKASPLPRKYSTCIEDTQSSLRLIAKQVRLVLEGLQSGQRSLERLQNTLREVETEAYKAALGLSEIEIAGGCDGCPAAPPTTGAQAHLLVLADVLEQQATLARACALPGIKPLTADPSILHSPNGHASGNGTPLSNEP